jgi:hypothetical protein
VIYSKGYFSCKQYLEALKEHVTTDVNALIHMRIATHGATSKANCHPFPITHDLEVMRATHGVTDAIMIHNGVLSNFTGLANNEASDSMKLAQYIGKAGIKHYNSSFFTRLLEPLLGTGNKVAVLTGRGFVKAGRGWSLEADGIYYSNDTYKYSYCGYNGGLGGGWNSHYNDDFDYYPYNETKRDFERESKIIKSLEGKKNVGVKRHGGEPLKEIEAGSYLMTYELQRLHEGECPSCMNVLQDEVDRVCDICNVRYI